MTNRYLCDVLDEMRKCVETRNFSYLGGLIEEAQTIGNRMETALADKKDIFDYGKTRSRMKKEVDLLRSVRNRLLDEMGIDFSDLDLEVWHDPKLKEILEEFIKQM